jgi:GNAT superfamily N-acetyltransferase
MDIQIRKAQMDDVPALADLLRGLGLFSLLSAETLEATQARVARHLALSLADDSHSVYVAESPSGEMVGYGAVHWLAYLILAGPEGYVSELFVRAAGRGLGVGRQLLATIKAEAQRRGCSRLMLLNRRQRESYRRQFYAKQGWEERKDMANFVYSLSEESH